MMVRVSKAQATLISTIALMLTLALAPVTAISAGRGPQQSKPSQPAAQSPGDVSVTTILVSPDEDYRIGPRDVLEIRVEKASELSGTYEVNADGTFLMHFVGRIQAQNKTREELARLIADALRGRYLMDPQVNVIVRQINSRSFFIQGAVRRPGVFQIEGRPSLLKIITLAGGLADDHGSIAYIIREHRPQILSRNGGSTEPVDRSKPSMPAATASAQSQATVLADEEEDKYELVTVNINGLLKGAFNQNIFIEPGDIINIPPADVFFVAGEVQAPGSFPLKDGTTLRQAISLAQGTTFKAASSRSVIFREDPTTGKRLEIKVDISAVMSGKKEDVPIVANDIIIVPNSRFKSIGSALLSAFGLSAARYPRRY